MDELGIDLSGRTPRQLEPAGGCRVGRRRRDDGLWRRLPGAAREELRRLEPRGPGVEAARARARDPRRDRATRRRARRASSVPSPTHGERPLLEWTRGGADRGARRRHGAPDGRRPGARRPPRRRARDLRSRLVRQDSGLPRRARCRRRCSSSGSARTASTPRRSTATSPAGSGTPPPARGSARSPSRSSTTSCRPRRTSRGGSPPPCPCSRRSTSSTGRSSRCGRPDAEVPEELVEQELEALRDSVAELVPAEGRPAREGDTLVVDIASPNGETQRDTVVELGAGALVDEVEQALARRVAGRDEERHVRAGRRVDVSGRGHGQGDQGEGAARGRRRARALGERVRHDRRAARRHRGAAARGARGRDRERLPRERRRRARRRVEASTRPGRSSSRGRASS